MRTLAALLALALPLLLTACGEREASLPSPLLAEQPDLPPGMAGLREVSGGDCPDVSRSGWLEMQSAGLDRRVLLLLPDEVEPGLPVVVAFHGMGGAPDRFAESLRLDDLARRGAIVVVPEAHESAPLTWGAGRGEGDGMLIEDLRHCLWRGLDADLAGVHVTGFSAGGLWTTLMLLHASEVLASATIYSGGELPPWIQYRTPEIRVPTLLLWGGKRDVYTGRGFSVAFTRATRRLSEHLAQDGHVVVRCDHGAGHSVPAEAAPLLHDWALSHRFGEPSPDSATASDALPEWCELVVEGG
jgi:poly(3-hydroxybutyrate) depolymerase